MSDKMEPPLICGAAGDPCIAEITKPVCPDTIDKHENQEIISVTSSTDVISTIPTPSNVKEILITDPLATESCKVTKAPPTAVPSTTTVPEVSPSTNGNENKADACLTNLQDEIQNRTNERDNYERKLVDTEKKLAALEVAYEAATSGKDDQSNLHRELKELKSNLAQSQAKLKDRARLMANQENQISALTKQVSSLKEVVAITKNLLEIRNMEVKHLQEDVDSMENRITAERDRHNAMIRKMDAAVRLNADLKNEYETQLRLFRDLRGKYEEKVTLLTNNEKTGCGAPATEPTPVPPASIQ